MNITKYIIKWKETTHADGYKFFIVADSNFPDARVGQGFTEKGKETIENQVERLNKALQARDNNRNYKKKRL